MNINIQISDIYGATPATVEVDRGTASTPTTGGATDGGAPTVYVMSESSGGVSASGLVDIGGPPQWLTEAIGAKGKSGGATTAEPSGEGGQGQEGGGAPSL